MNMIQNNFLAYLKDVPEQRVIALKWNDILRPNSSQWIKEMSSSLAFKKLTFIVRGKIEDLYMMWKPFIHFMNGLNVDPCDQTRIGATTITPR